mgnify:FL=1
MDIFFIITNVCALIVVLVSYILTLMALVIDDDDMYGIPLIGGGSALFSYIGYYIGSGISENVFVKYIWIASIFVILICLFIGITRRSRKSWIINIISLLGIAAFGCIPFLSISYKRIDLSIPELQYNQYSTIALVCICSFVVIVFFVFYLLNRTINRDKELRYQIYSLVENVKKRIVTYNTFAEPYAQLIKEDLRSEIIGLFHELRGEIVSGDKNRKTNYTKSNKQELIYKEVLSIKKQLSSTQQELPFNFSDLIGNIKHSLTTPLSQIQINCELLKSKDKNADAKEIILRIENASKVCLSIIHSYVEASYNISLPAFLELDKSIQSYFYMLLGENQSNMKLELKEFPSLFEGFSSNYIYAMIVPLLQNAVTASPQDETIIISSESTPKQYKISVSNTCKQSPPTLKDLQTQGYSSKQGHSGVGLNTVRNLLDLAKSGYLDFDITDNSVTVSIYLNKKRNDKE